MSKRKTTKQLPGSAKQSPKASASVREAKSEQLVEATVQASQSNAQTQEGSKSQSESSTRQAAKNPAVPSTKPSALRKQSRHQQKLAAQAQAARKRLITYGGIIAASVVILGLLGWVIVTANASKNNASANTNLANPPVDNILCEASEQLAYHVHAHLTIWVNGQKVALPQSIGIASDSSCIYWLHTHQTDGVIHIESPTEKLYTLGNFFNIWSGPFQTLQYIPELDQTNGWQVYVDGKLYTGDFHKLELKSHELITMAYNSPDIQPDTTYSWAAGE